MVGCTISLRATKPQEVELSSEDDEKEKKVIRQRNLVTNLDETNLKKIEDKFDALEKEASQRERNERLKKKKCVDYLQ